MITVHLHIFGVAVQRQLASVAFQVVLGPTKRCLRPCWKTTGKPNDSPKPCLQHERRPALSPGVIVDSDDLNAAILGLQRDQQIRRATGVDSAQRCFTCRVSPARGAAFDSLDVSLDGVQSGVAHEHAKFLLFASLACSKVIVLRKVVSSAKDVPAAMFE
jgi:hypothetical protein